MTEPGTAHAATTPHSTAEVQAAWDRLNVLYQDTPSDPRVAGARAAAEWTTGRTATSPITGETAPPEGLLLRGEGHAAAMTELGIRAGDRAYARGVSAWMFWWTGLEPLPPWLRR